MKYTIDFCQRAWEDEYINSSYEERISSNLKWMNYWDYLAKNSGSRSSSAYSNEIISFLKNENIFDKCSSVLDVGAGTGAYALPLAEICAHVTAADMSKESLDVLNKRAEGKKLSIETKCMMWENFQSNQNYDIVFSAMSPAICDVRSLEKMESYANKHCILITPAKNSYSKLRKAIRTKLTELPLPGLSVDVIYIFNFLYAQGKNPNLKCYSQQNQTKSSVDQAYEMYCNYFKIFDFTDDLSKNIIRNTIEESAKNGIVTDEIFLNTAVLYWDINDKNAL